VCICCWGEKVIGIYCPPSQHCTFEDYLDRAVEHVESQPGEEVTVHKTVGILQWVTGKFFGTYTREAKALDRRMNKQLSEYLRTSIALLHEIHTRKSQSLHFRRLGDGTHIFRPRTSRVGGIDGVSNPRPFKHHPGEVIF
jgi:hypothetical protein